MSKAGQMRETAAQAVGHVLRDPHALTPLVLLMGFIGATLRYLLESVLPAEGGFPAATLLVNVFGCFTLEIINQYIARRTKLPAPLVKSMGVGLIGAFTTIAALSTENLTFLRCGRWGMFAFYLVVTATSTFLAAYAGKMAADWLGRGGGGKKSAGLTSAARPLARSCGCATGQATASATIRAKSGETADTQQTGADEGWRASTAAVSTQMPEETACKMSGNDAAHLAGGNGGRR